MSVVEYITQYYYYTGSEFTFWVDIIGLLRLNYLFSGISAQLGRISDSPTHNTANGYYACPSLKV